MVNTRHVRALLEITDCRMASMLKSGIRVRLKVLRVQGKVIPSVSGPLYVELVTLLRDF